MSVCCCSEERIRNGAKKLEKSRTTVTQGRLDNFFQVVSVTSTKRKVITRLPKVTDTQLIAFPRIEYLEALYQCQGSQKPGIVREFCKPGKVRFLRYGQGKFL